MYDTDPKRNFAAEYSAMIRRQVGIGVPLLLAFVACDWFEEAGTGTILGYDARAVFAVLGAAVFAYLLYTIRNWRCPACRAYLGNFLWLSKCPACKVSYKDG